MAYAGRIASAVSSAVAEIRMAEVLGELRDTFYVTLLTDATSRARAALVATEHGRL